MLINTFEAGVASGTAVTTLNSDDDGGSTFTPTKANGGLMTFDATHTHRGALALLIDATAGVTAVSRADITSGNADETIDLYLWMDSYPGTSGARLAEFFTSGSNVRFGISTTGMLQIFNSAGTALFTGTHALTLSAWNRIAMRVAVAGGAGTAGTIRAELYVAADAETTTPTETYTPTPGTSTTGTVSTIGSIRIGKVDSLSTFKVWLDDMARDQGVNNVAPRTPGTDFFKTVSDGVGITDSAADVLAIVRQPNDLVDIEDLPGPQQLDVLTVAADPVGISDALVVEFVHLPLLALADPESITDDVQTAEGLVRSANEPIGISDNVTPIRGFPRGAADNLGIVDHVTAVLVATVTTREGFATIIQHDGESRLTNAASPGLAGITPELAGAATLVPRLAGEATIQRT